MRAGKYLGVSPWELMRQPSIWVQWALTAEAAEIGARNVKKTEVFEDVDPGS